MARFPAPDKGFPDNGTYTTDDKGYKVGATSVGVVNGTGAIADGESVRFGPDPTEYSVVNGTSGAGALTIAPPLRAPIPPAELPVQATTSDPVKINANRELATLYNGLQTDAAQAHLIAKVEVLHAGLAASYGTGFHQWFNAIRGLNNPDEYSGPDGVAEIETIAAAVKTSHKAAEAAKTAAKDAEADKAAESKKPSETHRTR